MVVKRGLRLHHPELDQVPSGLGALGPERGAETVDLAQTENGCFQVELAGLREERLSQVEVVDREKARRVLPAGRGEDGGVDQGEIVFVEILTHMPHQGVAHTHDGCLAAGSEPEMAVVQEKIGAVLLFPDGELLLGLMDDIHPGDVQLVPAR